MSENPIAELNQSKPKWDSGLGYLFLLDDLIKLACGYLIIEDYTSYYQCLESWYISTAYWFETSKAATALKVTVKKDGKETEISAVDHLKALRAAAGPTQPGVLKNYHEQLDKLSNAVGLRLGSTKELPGVLKV